jgi:hypothetical protein
MKTADLVHLRQRRATVHRGCLSFLRILRKAYVSEPAAVPTLERVFIEHYTTLFALDAQLKALEAHLAPHVCPVCKAIAPHLPSGETHGADVALTP